jgi:hypothetical protein
MWSFMRFLRDIALMEDHVRIAEMLKNILVEKKPLDLSVRILQECRYEPTEIVEVSKLAENKTINPTSIMFTLNDDKVKLE